MRGPKLSLRALLLVLAGLAASLPASAAQPAPPTPVKASWPLIESYCEKCHNANDWAGGVAFDTMAPESVAQDAEVWEKAVRKLRGNLMPPPGKAQPDMAARKALIASLEGTLDAAASAHPNPGSVVLHRLNRTEYANAVGEILDLGIDPTALLPRDDKADGFDNVADVLKVSPAFLEQYLSAARQVSIAALGNVAARPTSRIYHGTAQAQQYVHLEGLPLGTRGGMLIEDDFPADGDYEININGLVGGGYVWGVMDPNTLIVTVDDARVFQDKLGGEADLEAVDVKQAGGVAAINGRFEHIHVHLGAGPHRIGVTYRAKTAAESDEILHSWVPVTGMSRWVNGNSGGPRIQTVEVKGPLKATGVGQTPSRRKIFVCYPRGEREELPCARQILSGIAAAAFRRPVTDEDVAGALSFYQQGRQHGGFEAGIQKGLMAILVSPKFLYRTHTPPAGLSPGASFRLSDMELASRLSFFLWSRPPDEELIQIAAKGELRQPQVLTQQLKRLLADPRAHALVTNFAFQWLNVHGLDLVDPDQNLFPDYTPDLVGDFKRELELFIGSIFEADQSVLALLSADHTFLNERLALHYGIQGVRGGRFVRVTVPQPYRRGLLGKGAFLMVTSYANRTTPVLRGAYVLEKLLGTPPSSPPPGVQAFVETQEGGVALTVRERLQTHRSQESCNACHAVIDPIGLSLENFNAIGQWRERDIDAGAPIDAMGKMMDGTVLKGVDDLRKALIARSGEFAQTFTENLMTFALGRTLRYYDMPTVRAIVRTAAQEDYRLSAIILGIVSSDAFQMDGVALDKPQPVPQQLAANR
jgi:hypothetical protein